MTQQRDIERLLDHWFGDGPGRAPDRVVDIVADRIERQSQRPAWRLHRRETTTVSIIPKPYAAVAAVLIVGVVGLAAVVGLAPRGGVGVSGPTSTPAATPPASAAPTIRPTTAPTKAVAATPALPAPAALQGRWRAEIPDVAILTFTATGYTINWLGVGTGRIEVEGDKITFLGSRDPEQCPDGGTYRWSIEGDKLHLEPVGTDPCPFQTEWAGNRTYTRYD